MNTSLMGHLRHILIHRRKMLELFRQKIEGRTDGGREIEGVVHQVIFPLHKTSDEVPLPALNLWMIDERLAYHHYLASDKELRAFDVFDTSFVFADQPSPWGSMAIVEFVRPARDGCPDAGDPIAQVYTYISKMREGRAKDRSGHPLSVNPYMPFYCYVICDLTSHMRTLARHYGLMETPDGQGFFGFNLHYRAHIEIMTFDKALSDAERRNRLLLDRLDLSTV